MVTLAKEDVKKKTRIQKFYLVWNENRGAPTVKHPTFDEALGEAERLAVKHPDDMIHVLESVGTCWFERVHYERHE